MVWYCMGTCEYCEEPTGGCEPHGECKNEYMHRWNARKCVKCGAAPFMEASCYCGNCRPGSPYTGYGGAK